MSIREKNGRWVVETYDPITRKKVYVRPSDHGMHPPKNERQARKLERLALAERDKRRPGGRDETIGSFAARWPDDFPKGKAGRTRGESTRINYKERIRAFTTKYEGRALRSFTIDEAMEWATQSPGTVAVLRTMFGDALRARRVDHNPFSGLGVTPPKGREDITVLTPAEVDKLAECARDVHGPEFGTEIAALIVWLAFTCMRPGEAFVARYSLLNGDVYDVRSQWNKKLGRETPPKHGSVGAIYVPGQARAAVLGKPRRIDDDLMFRGKRGGRLHQQGLHRAWVPVRERFMAGLPVGHHLHQRLALDPADRLDPYELRHAGAAHMLNDLGLEPWVIARQLRHSDDGALVVSLYGHPTRKTAIEKMRRAFSAAKPVEISEAREQRAKEA